MVDCVCLSVLGRVAEILDLKTSGEQVFFPQTIKKPCMLILSSREVLNNFQCLFVRNKH